MAANTQVPVVIYSGPTGGHFFPALSFASSLRAQYPQAKIHFVINKAPEFIVRALAQQKFHLHQIPLSAPRTVISLTIFSFLLNYLLAFVRSLILLLKMKPRLVVGFGSFASVPGILAGSLLKIPILLHEQNVLPGLANQFLAVWANKVAVSFEESRNFLPIEKVVWSGFPLRSPFLNNLSRRVGGDRSLLFTVFVLGGSQGASRLDQVLIETFESLSSEERALFAVIHSTGKGNANTIREAYQRMGIQSEVFTFADDIWKKYLASDLVICRAGAGTLFEIAAMERASILIPYPHARNHQLKNAIHLMNKGGAVMLMDQTLNEHALRRTLLSLHRNSRERLALAKNAHALFKRDALSVLTNEAWQLQCLKN